MLTLPVMPAILAMNKDSSLCIKIMFDKSVGRVEVQFDIKEMEMKYNGENFSCVFGHFFAKTFEIQNNCFC